MAPGRHPETICGVRPVVPLIAAAAMILPAPTAAAKLPLRPCVVQGLKARCGTLLVPENRTLPTTRTIGLRVVVLPALGRPVRRDPFVYLAGGPGGAATESAAAVSSIWFGLRRSRDVLLVDQRGTGGSNALACATPAVAPTTPDALSALVRDCTAALPGDASQYGTGAAMDDLEAVRVALGYGKLDLYGISYGATAAQVFLRRHPGSVRTVVLDGGTLLDIPIFERWASNGQRALDLLAARCTADPACRRAFPTWRADLPGLLTRLQAEPVTVEAAGESVSVDDVVLADTIQNLTRSAGQAVYVPLLVTRAAAGDYSVLGKLMGVGSPDLRVMPWSVRCNEPWARFDPAAAAADAVGTYLARSQAADSATNALICGAFPRREEPPTDWTRAQSNVPLLALVGGADPQDPLGNIAGIREAMPNARLVVIPGQGHGVGPVGCAPALVSTFVGRGSAAGLDTRCVRRTSLPGFVLR